MDITQKNIKKNNEMLDVLEDNKIELLAKKYIEVEKKLLAEINKLENSGIECNCKVKDYLKFVYEDGDFDEIHAYCLKCGGYVNYW